MCGRGKDTSLHVHRLFAPRLPSRGDVYVSGSAYKIVKDRAYHHGTMLISTKLDTLGELLRTNKVRPPALFPGTSRSLIEGQ